MRKIVIMMLGTAALMCCTSKLKKENEALSEEIEQRREALVEHQQQELEAAQKELALTDSLLTAVSEQHDTLHQWVMEHSTELGDNSPEVARLNQLRATRDSLKVRFEVLGEKIKYIHEKQKE